MVEDVLVGRVAEGGFYMRERFMDCRGAGKRWDIWGIGFADWGCLAARCWFLAGGEVGSLVGCLGIGVFWMRTKEERRGKRGDARAQTPGR